MQQWIQQLIHEQLICIGAVMDQLWLQLWKSLENRRGCERSLLSHFTLHVLGVTGPCEETDSPAESASPKSPGFEALSHGEAAINYLAWGGKGIQQCSRIHTAHLRITGLKPVCVIGRDIVISRDHLSNLPQPTTSTSTSLSCSAAIGPASIRSV